MADYMGYLVAIIAILGGVLGLPWIIFHYVTRWKMQATITKEDENLLDELYELARRLDDRMCTLERIMSADNPGWRTIGCDPASIGIADEVIARRSVK